MDSETNGLTWDTQEQRPTLTKKDEAKDKAWEALALALQGIVVVGILGLVACAVPLVVAVWRWAF
jgi:hypothetical protein